MQRHVEVSAKAVERLQSQLGSLRSGCPEDLTTPLGPRTEEVDKDAWRAEIANSLLAVCMPHLDKSKRLNALEIAKLRKLGTSSKWPGYAIPATVADSLEDGVLRYFAARKSVGLDGKAARYANDYVRSQVPTSRIGLLRLIDLEIAAARKFPHGTGLGFPVCSSDFEKFGFTVYKISEEIHNSGYDCGWVKCLPSLLGMRGQQRGPISVVGTPYAKVRVIYAMPRAIMNVEKRIQFPLQGYLKNANEVFAAWQSRSAVAKAITRMFALKPRRILSVDFSSFDVSVPLVVLGEVFKIVKGWFTSDAAPVIDFCQEAFTKGGIICPGLTSKTFREFSGEERSGGVPSGSVLTNLIDSLVNLWVMAYAAALNSSSISFALVQGDDGVYVFRDGVTKEEISNAVSTLGMVISVEKSMECQGAVHFLQDLHEEGHFVDGLNVGQRPFSHIVNNAMNMERNDGKPWTRVDDSVRWLQQWGEGLYHPGFEAASAWLFDRDWMTRDIIDRIRKGDVTWIPESIRRVNRKDSNSFWGLSAQSFLSSPTVQHLLTRRQ